VDALGSDGRGRHDGSSNGGGSLGKEHVELIESIGLGVVERRRLV